MLVSTGKLRVPTKRYVHPVLSALLVGVIFFVILPRVVNVSAVWRTIDAMTWLELVTLSAVALWNLATYWIVLLKTVPGLSIGQAIVVTESSTALANSLPGGPAFGLGVAYSMYASWGFDTSKIALALLYSGMADLFAKLTMPLVALVLLLLTGTVSFGLVTVGLLGAVILVVSIVLISLALRSDRGARQVGDLLARVASRFLRLVGRAPVTSWGERFASFRHEATRTFRNRWHGIIAAGLLSHFSLYLVLLISLRHVGVSEREVSWIEVLGAFAFVRLVAALPLTPGGLGVVELGLTAVLVVSGGARTEVVAAVLVFRALTYLVQIPFGVGTYLYWRHGRAWKRAHPELTEPLGG